MNRSGDLPEETRNPMSDIVDGETADENSATTDEGHGVVPESLERAESTAEIQLWKRTLVAHAVTHKENERDRRKRLAQDQLEGSSIIDPDGNFRRKWDVMQMILLVYVAFGVPFRLGFSVPVVIWSGWFWFDAFVDVYFVSDIAISFRTAFYNSRGELEVNKDLIKRGYVKSWFIIDVASCFPGSYISYFFGDNGTSGSKTIKLLRMFRLLKLLRLARFNRLLQRYEEEFYSLMTTFKLGKLVILMIVIGHWLSCMWFAIGSMNSDYLDTHGQPIIGWVDQEFGGAATKNVFFYYGKSFYWAVMTMTTVGYGDIVPTTEWETLVAIISMIIGGFVFGLIVGSLAELSKRANPGELMRQKSVARVASMLHSGAAKVVTPDLARRVRAYYSNYYSRRTALDFFGFIVSLPADLRDDLARQMHWVDGVTSGGMEVFGMLHKITFFSGLDSLSCIYICARMKVIQTFPMIYEGEDRLNLVMEEGDDAEDMFIVIDTSGGGRSVVLEKEDEVIGRLGAGDFFGELGALLPNSMAAQRKRTRTAYTTTDTQLGVLSYDDLLGLQRERFQIAERIVPYVNAVASQLVDAPSGPVVSTLDAYPELKTMDEKMDRVLAALDVR